MSNPTLPAGEFTFPEAVAHLKSGNFSTIESLFDESPTSHEHKCAIIQWVEAGLFAAEPEALAEALTCACMLGKTRVAAWLLDHGVDPLAGTATGLNGFHYAVWHGNVDTVRMLIERHVPLECINMYGGTVLGCAVHGAENAPQTGHREIIEMLIAAGADLDCEPGLRASCEDILQSL